MFIQTALEETQGECLRPLFCTKLRSPDLVKDRAGVSAPEGPRCRAGALETLLGSGTADVDEQGLAACADLKPFS